MSPEVRNLQAKYLYDLLSLVRYTVLWDLKPTSTVGSTFILSSQSQPACFAFFIDRCEVCIVKDRPRLQNYTEINFNRMI